MCFLSCCWTTIFLFSSVSQLTCEVKCLILTVRLFELFEVPVWPKVSEAKPQRQNKTLTRAPDSRTLLFLSFKVFTVIKRIYFGSGGRI